MPLFLLHKCFAWTGPRGTVQNPPNICYFSGNIWKKKKVCYNLGLALCSRQMREDAKQNGKETWLKLKREHQSRKARSLKLIQQKRGKNALCLILKKSLKECVSRTHTFYCPFVKTECKCPNSATGTCPIRVHNANSSTYGSIKHKPAHLHPFHVLKSSDPLSPK